MARKPERRKLNEIMGQLDGFKCQKRANKGKTARKIVQSRGRLGHKLAGNVVEMRGKMQVFVRFCMPIAGF